MKEKDVENKIEMLPQESHASYSIQNVMFPSLFIAFSFTDTVTFHFSKKKKSH